MIAWVQRQALAILGALLAAAIVTAGVQSVRLHLSQRSNDALVKKVAKVEGERDQARGVAKASEAARAEERVQASLSYAEQSLRCDARVNQARASATAIQEIVNGPVSSAPNGGAVVRRIVGAGQLRQVIGQPARGADDRVPSGSDGAKAR